MGAVCTVILVLVALIIVLCCWHPVAVLVISINTTGPAPHPQTVVAPPPVVVSREIPVAPVSAPAADCSTSEEFNPPVTVAIPQEDEFGEEVSVAIPKR